MSIKRAVSINGKLYARLRERVQASGQRMAVVVTNLIDKRLDVEAKQRVEHEAQKREQS